MVPETQFGKKSIDALTNSVLYYSDINKIKAKEKHSESEQMKQVLAHCVSAHLSWSSLNQHYKTYIHASVSTFDYHDTTNRAMDLKKSRD